MRRSCGHGLGPVLEPEPAQPRLQRLLERHCDSGCDVCGSSYQHVLRYHLGGRVAHVERVSRFWRMFWYRYRKRTVSLWYVCGCVAADVPGASQSV